MCVISKCIERPALSAHGVGTIMQITISCLCVCVCVLGMIRFSSKVSTIYEFDTYQGQEETVAATRETPFVGGRTNTADALEAVSLTLIKLNMPVVAS